MTPTVTEVSSELKARTAPSVPRPSYALIKTPTNKTPKECAPKECAPKECAPQKIYAPSPCAVSPTMQTNTKSVTPWATSALMIRANKDSAGEFNLTFLTTYPWPNEDMLILKENKKLASETLIENKELASETLIAECGKFWKTISGTGYREEMEVGTPPTSE
eukprot:CAMPEP_0196824732 /NCGR_PEP_ID=MMETSP1362-20130617/92655_1 /TAXON_ID=163516 /ORGANISM="Leptocylindrus danicus, Strain CCMP1856" /LENGTH=162 /DNA_ID=CAMNT_0042205063 /DNA_START=383 /DNA_END=871 /DNA_ORIENTATION=+